MYDSISWYVADVDFSGLFVVKDDYDPVSVKS